METEKGSEMEQARLKVLQLCKNKNTSVERVDLFEEAIKAVEDHDCYFYALTGDMEGVSSRVRCKTKSLELSRRALKKMSIASLIKLYRELKSIRPDVVVAHRTRPAKMLALISLIVPIPRKIVVIHGMGQLKKARTRLFARLFMSRNWEWVGVSKAVKDDIARSGIDENRIHVINNSVDESFIKDNLLERDQARRELGIPPGEKRVCGQVGRLHPVKGHEYVIKALDQAEDPAFVVAIGGGELLEELQEKAHGKRMLLAGPRPNAYRYMKAFDALIIPSISEGLPMVALEAIAAGVPVFGTPVGGIPEILRNEKWRFSPRDPSAIGRLLDWINSASGEQLREVAEAQYRIFREEYSIQNYRASFRSLIAGDS